METEKERYKFEMEKAQFDRDRAMVELERAKRLLDYDAEHHKARMEALEEHPTTIRTAAARKSFSF